MRSSSAQQLDFLDLGASKGDSYEFAIRKLRGDVGLGIDRDPAKVSSMRSRGYPCVVGDATALDYADGTVRFAVLNHFLEHLPDEETVVNALREAIRVSREFVYVRGPYFDADEELASIGLKFYWSDWSGHPTHVTTDMLRNAIPGGTLTPSFFYNAPVRTAADPSLHPLASPVNQHEYNPREHPPKPDVDLPSRSYREVICVIPLRPGVPTHRYATASGAVYTPEGKRVRPTPGNWCRALTQRLIP